MMGTFRSLRIRVLMGAAALALTSTLTLPAFAQGSNQPQGNNKQAAEAAKEGQKKINEIADARRLIPGPAGNPECVWLGQRVVGLLWRDDLDTAFRHLDLYDRFGCPSGHIQTTFRCLVKQGNIDPKAPEALNSRIHACWIDPDLPATAAAQATSDNPQGKTPGTDNKATR
jgi:hypothetical protein